MTLDGTPLTAEEISLLDTFATESMKIAFEFWQDEMREDFIGNVTPFSSCAYTLAKAMLRERRRLHAADNQR